MSCSSCLWQGLPPSHPPLKEEEEEACLRATKGGSPGEAARRGRLLMASSQAEADPSPSPRPGSAGSLCCLGFGSSQHRHAHVATSPSDARPSHQPSRVSEPTSRLWWRALATQLRSGAGGAQRLSDPKPGVPQGASPAALGSTCDPSTPACPLSRSQVSCQELNGRYTFTSSTGATGRDPVFPTVLLPH